MKTTLGIIVTRCRQGLRTRLDRAASIDLETFRRGLGDLGIRPGDAVFVHSAFGQMGSIRATPLELVEALSEAVGPSGTLAMPSYPMTGRSQHYLDTDPVFDHRRTPSLAGILTETLRRMPGTERSLHPTHPVVARGALAPWLTEGHVRSALPFDEHSPFHRLLEADASVLRLGRFAALSFRHLAEHLIRDEIAYPIYARKPTTVRLIDRDGTELRMTTRGHNPRLFSNFQVVARQLAKEGKVGFVRLGRVHASLLSVREYVDAFHRCHAAREVRYRVGRRKLRRLRRRAP